jgi:hypothetical protein
MMSADPDALSAGWPAGIAAVKSVREARWLMRLGAGQPSDHGIS